MIKYQEIKHTECATSCLKSAQRRQSIVPARKTVDLVK